MNMRGLAVAGLTASVIAGCVTPPAEPTPTPTVRPTAAQPSFELASYMYALQTKGKIRIGQLDKDIPFALRDSSGIYSGFDVELGRELAKAIFGPQQNADQVIESVSFNPDAPERPVSLLVNGEVDVVIARLVVNDERAASIDLTEPYFVSGERILIKSSNDEIKDLPDLDTKTVCVPQGSPVAEHVVEANAFARTLELDGYPSCLGALQQGQVDAIGAEERILWSLMKLDPNTKIVGRNLTTERYAIGVKKHAGDRQGFLPFLNSWLAGAIRDGTWARLYAQHVTPYSRETKTAPTQ